MARRRTSTYGGSSRTEQNRKPWTVYTISPCSGRWVDSGKFDFSRFEPLYQVTTVRCFSKAGTFIYSTVYTGMGFVVALHQRNDNLLIQEAGTVQSHSPEWHKPDTKNRPSPPTVWAVTHINRVVPFTSWPKPLKRITQLMLPYAGSAHFPNQ